MARQILKTTQTESEVLDTDWYGEYQIVCTVYASDPVKLQFLRPGSTTWITARYNNTEIQLSSVGDVLDVKLTKGYDYRLHTENEGAEVFIDKHDPHS